MSLLHPLKTFKNATCTVTRDALGTHVDGEYVPGAPSVFADVPMSFRPVSGRDRKSIPEGVRTEDVRAVMCEFELAPDDIVTGYKGESWRVFNVRDWDVRGQTYVRALVSRTRIGA